MMFSAVPVFCAVFSKETAEKLMFCAFSGFVEGRGSPPFPLQEHQILLNILNTKQKGENTRICAGVPCLVIRLVPQNAPYSVGIPAEFASAKRSRFRQHLRSLFGVAFGRPTT